MPRSSSRSRSRQAPCRSGSTAAGLILGARLAGLRSDVVAVRVVDRFACNRRLLALHVKAAARFIRRHSPGAALKDVHPRDIFFIDDFAGPTYARFTREALEAVSLAGDCDAIKLEGTYTGKTFAAALDFMHRNGLERRPALFWNTYSSADLYPEVKDVDYHALPAELHRYFEEPLQEEELGFPVHY
jgi:1-aminocyclopropane-1-carboxylate deaminase/D-cysteine desulfhydrase-like pyridoxal-dependent ACC family enzyme